MPPADDRKNNVAGTGGMRKPDRDLGSYGVSGFLLPISLGLVALLSYAAGAQCLRKAS